LCSARRGINLCANPGANNSTVAVDEVAIDAGMMVGILLENGEITARRSVAGLAGRDRAVGHNLLPDHQIGALLRKRNNNVHVIWRRLFQQRLVYLQRLLSTDVCRRAAHLARLWCGPW